jgi:hypothetical protein
MFHCKTRECVQQVFMPNFESCEVLVCLRVDEAGIPPTPSFNCQCELCGARIWVAHNSPLEPARIVQPAAPPAMLKSVDSPRTS